MGPLHHHTHCQYHSEEGILGKSDPSLTHILDSTVIWDSSKEAVMGREGVYLKLVPKSRQEQQLPTQCNQGSSEGFQMPPQWPDLQRAEKRIRPVSGRPTCFLRKDAW